MKLSTDANSPYYLGTANMGRYVVDLNGKRVEYVVEVDDADGAGFVTFLKTDKHGLRIVDKVKGQVARETLYGKVKIIDLRAATVAKPAWPGIGGPR